MLNQTPDRSEAFLDDEQIKDLARTDPQRAMSLVVQRHRAGLVRHATGIVKDSHLASDMVQEVFIKAMREERFFEPEFRMGAWLFRVTNNLCLNTVRDRRRRSDILETIPLPRATEAEQLRSVTDDERHSQVQAAMEMLSANHRRILHERFYRDLSYAEIAEVLDIRLGTVMSRLSRAKAALLDVIDGSPVVDL
jgi:RNA polymerase sigma factor (sigma-70 family)